MSKDTNFSAFTLNIRKNIFEFHRPVVMGILNLTPDSFYDGGRYTDIDSALLRATQLLADGADILDLGAASSRPGATLPSTEVEIERLLPVITQIRRHHPDAIISVDTCNAQTADAAISAGADIINDISGGTFDPQMFPTIAERQVPYILMHTTGRPDDMQENCSYSDIIQDLILFFSSRLNQLYSLGVKDVVIDPGFGFGKTLDQNFELLNRLSELTSAFVEPLLVGVSRKSMIYRTLSVTPDLSLNGTTVINTQALLSGARILRVHDARPAREAISLLFREAVV